MEHYKVRYDDHGRPCAIVDSERTVKNVEKFVANINFVEALRQENRELKDLADDLAERLESVKIGCHTAESEAAKRYGANWRNDYIEAALDRYRAANSNQQEGE